MVELESREIRSNKALTEARQTKTAIVLTGVTLLLFGVLAVVTGTPSPDEGHLPDTWFHRWLDEANDDANGDDGSNKNDNGTTDYTGESCSDIYKITPDVGEEQCQFAKTCNGGFGIWASFVFCSNSTFSTATLCRILSPFVLLWLVLLFRMLGSTAEDYFSPSLEMFSSKLGLPPRFAGVTLLALGNGAADVSATKSAITTNPVKGYKLSLGALTGAAMIISGVVSACVVIAADGVPCRGALLRDACMLLLTVVVVWVELASGTIGPDSISLFFSLYAAFVLLVLAADVYHRAVILPRRAVLAQARERNRQLEQEAALNPGTDPPEQPRTGRLSNMITALSNYDNDPNAQGWGAESEDLAQDRPVLLHGSHGILKGDGHIPTPEDHVAAAGIAGDGTQYSMLEDAVDMSCVDPTSLGVPATNWSGAFHDGTQELIEHATALWDDIVWNGDVHIATKFLLLCELPFTTLRKLTVPLPCEGYYVRIMVVLSLALSPPFFAIYLAHAIKVKVLSELGITLFLSFWGIAIGCALFVLRFAPGGNGQLSLWVATPVALYGFMMAAAWIDTIATLLVSLLEFLGIILGIPGPVVGLTILAWGNSMADLSANMTMARKGLANMAMTACFAGPVFNILVGLGLGFSTLAAKTGNSEASVTLPPSVLIGFIFIILTAISILVTGLGFGNGTITKQYGYVALTLYAMYLITSIIVQIYKKPEDNGDP